MFKRFMAILMAAILMMGYAHAAGSYIGDMRVANCNEWVSLREYPDESSDRLIKVPLGETVTNCRQENAEFIYAEYNGWCGYIMAKYLINGATGGYIGDMWVANCNEWVSLRQYPDESSDRLIKVPLNAMVTNCRWENSEFIYAEYNNWCGYIMAKYLVEDGNYGTTMKVVNCNEWVSLREYPDESSDRMFKVPLGATVYNCMRENSKFYYCEYNDVGGYILAEYLSSGGYADAVSSATY